MMYVRVLMLAILCLSAWSSADAARATWDRNPEPVLGYILAYGTQSGVHTVEINVGNVSTYEFFPPPGQRYYVVVKAYNAAGTGPASAEVILDLRGQTNQPPTLTRPANQTSARNQPASLTLIGNDPEGAALRYSASGLPPGLAVNATSGVISGTPNTSGQFTVSATVSDGSLTATRSFTWTITNSTNQPPTLAQPANQSTVRNQWDSLRLAGSDPEGAALRYSASGLPPGLTVNATSGVISGRPTTVGSSTVTARVSDNVSTVSRTFTWRVTSSSTNDTKAPVVAVIRPTPGQVVSGTVRLSATASDLSGVDFVRFNVNGSAIGAQETAAPYTMDWNSAGRPNGTYRITATARDNAGNVQTSTAITIYIRNGQSSTASADASTADASLAAADASLAAVDAAAPNVEQPADQESVVADEVTMQIEAPAAVRGDFDGDGRSDPAVFTASTGEWVVWGSSVNFSPSLPVVFGTSGDVPVPADYDGDARVDFAVFSPQSGTWRALLSSTEYRSTLEVQWGSAGDRPVTFDYDNDGRADLAVPRSGGFEVRLSSSNYTRSVTIGR
jgi:hypothetical protein